MMKFKADLQGRNLNLKASSGQELNLKRTRRFHKPRAKTYLPSACHNVLQALVCTLRQIPQNPRRSFPYRLIKRRRRLKL
ncbi:hypothetical protein [uncultured Campylobacter sp.]|uniref:hypothetical protein n=1 Tax=uncultured Campylobacter sp. TaxID=218934 RepID=UPI0026133858|nr:hypothetical protein [uncultured Campylobacter sp.]